MELVKWDKTLETGIKIIDEQHKNLLTIINNLFTNYASPTATIDLDAVFAELEKYSKIHFATEEELMKKFNYEETNAHIAEHEQFKKNLSKLKDLYNEKLSDSTALMFTFLRDWLVNHIQDSDRAYMNCFKSNMITEL